MPDRIAEAVLRVLARVAVEEADISSTCRGITSKNRRLASRGLLYMNSASESGVPYFSHSSIVRPLPFDFEIFWPFSSRKSS